MAGNIPNVSRENFKYANLLIGGLSTIYDGVPLQQGVPVIDSDINEMQDYQRMGRILDNMALTGIGFTRYGLTANDTGGYLIKQSTTTSNNFAIGAGFASIAGMVVPSTTDSPPVDFEYSEQILYSGTLTGVATNDLEDTDKLWTDADELVASASTPIHGACIVVVVSAATAGENGHAAYITSKTATTVTIDVVNSVPGYTIIDPANLAALDTYKILVPQLTTPSGGRTDEVYLQLWFDDINENEDADIVNTDVLVEAVHKTAKRWAVRVSEGDVTPTGSASDAYGFGVRYAKIGSLGRLSYNDAIMTAQITNDYSCFTGLSSMNPLSIHFDDTVMQSLGYPNLAAADENIQDAIDTIITELASTVSGDGSALTGSASVAGTPSSLSAGTLISQLSALLGFVNDRIESVNPTTTIDAPIPIFRSHGLPLDVNTNVTLDTVTIYLVKAIPKSTRPGIAICTGCYLSSTSAYTGTSGTIGNASAWFFNSELSFYATKIAPGLGSSWSFATYSAWSYYSQFHGVQGSLLKSPLHVLDCPISLTDVLTLGPDDASYIKKELSSSTIPLPMMIATESTGSIGYPAMYALEGVATTGAEVGGWWLLQNCIWNTSTDLWNQVNSSKASSAFLIGSEGFVFYRKAAGASPWALTAWDYKATLGASASDKAGGAGSFFFSGLNVEDNAYEQIKYIKGWNDTYGASIEIEKIYYETLNYRSRFENNPSSYLFVGTKTVGTTVTMSAGTAWGCTITVSATNASGTSQVHDVSGYVAVIG